MKFDWNILYIIEKIFLRDIKYCHGILKIDVNFKKYEHSKFLDNKSLNFGTLTWGSWGNVTFGCSPRGKAHNIL
jgi:hypothetical protein